MITVKIGTIQRELENVDADWVHKMIKSLRDSPEGVCVVVNIKEPQINIIFSTKACGHGGGNSANFNEKEKKIIALWRKHLGDDDKEVVPGHLIAFLSQLGRFVG